MPQATTDRPISVTIVTTGNENEDIEQAGALRLALADAYRIEVVDVVYGAGDCLRRLEQRAPDVMLIVDLSRDTLATELSRQVNVVRGGATATLLLVESGRLNTEYYDRAAAGGARRVIALSSGRERLIAAVMDAANVRVLAGKATGSAAVRSQDQLSIAVASAKGGVGKTFLSANLAAYLAANRPAKKVALVDLNLQFSALPPMMDLSANRSVHDLLSVIGDLKPADVESVMLKYPVGAGHTLQVLPAPVDPRQADDILGEHINSILLNLQRQFDVVILDTTSTVSDISIEGLRQCDRVFLVCTPDVLAVAQTRNLLEYLNTEGGIPREQMNLVFNQASSRNRITAKEMEKLFEIPLAAVIPFEPRVQEYVNSGTLLVQHSQVLPRVDGVMKGISTWADRLVPPPESRPDAARSRDGRGRRATVPAAGSTSGHPGRRRS